MDNQTTKTMSKKVKTFIVMAILFISLPICIAFGFRFFTKSIYKQRTCEWANIDNLELHAKVNVPKITSSDCDYNEATNTKKAFFNVNKNLLDTISYIKLNQLNPIQKLGGAAIEKFLKFDELATESTSYYYKENQKDGEFSYVLFNADEGKLWVTVKYAD